MKDKTRLIISIILIFLTIFYIRILYKISFERFGHEDTPLMLGAGAAVFIYIFMMVPLVFLSIGNSIAVMIIGIQGVKNKNNCFVEYIMIIIVAIVLLAFVATRLYLFHMHIY